MYPNIESDPLRIKKINKEDGTNCRENEMFLDQVNLTWLKSMAGTNRDNRICVLV